MIDSKIRAGGENETGCCWKSSDASLSMIRKGSTFENLPISCRSWMKCHQSDGFQCSASLFRAHAALDDSHLSSPYKREPFSYHFFNSAGLVSLFRIHW